MGKQTALTIDALPQAPTVTQGMQDGQCILQGH